MLKFKILNLIFRYRYLQLFILIGFSSIVLEVLLVKYVIPGLDPYFLRIGIGFMCGLAFSFLLNATVNFQIPRKDLLRAFVLFTSVSVFSFTMNMAMMYFMKQLFTAHYVLLRLITSGMLFSIAYQLHRQYTFKSAKNFGIPVYINTGENVQRIFEKIGFSCDHVHIDLVDDTVRPDCTPVDLDKLKQARSFWGKLPFCLHIMSKEPERWVKACIDDVDWLLFHNYEGIELFDLFWYCRQHGKKCGVVWHVDNQDANYLRYLPHIDFVMVLGIQSPGESGQELLPEALQTTRVFDAMMHLYSYEVIFDGGVTLKNVKDIPAKYVVAASAVLNHQNPIRATQLLISASHEES